jgi:Uma2 family endonuclease
MSRFPEHIRSNEVRPVTVADEIHRVTVDEYIRIVRDFGWESTELIEGVVYDVTPEFNRHMGTVMRVFRQLDAQFVDEAVINAGSVRLSRLSMVDPDVCVLDMNVPLDPDDAVPVAAVKLIVEVMVTSQSLDRGPKLIAYAKAGIPEVWLIDPRPDIGELVRYRDPDGASYLTVDRFDVGEDAAGLDVTEILKR